MLADKNKDILTPLEKYEKCKSETNQFEKDIKNEKFKAWINKTKKYIK